MTELISKSSKERVRRVDLHQRIKVLTRQGDVSVPNECPLCHILIELQIEEALNKMQCAVDALWTVQDNEAAELYRLEAGRALDLATRMLSELVGSVALPVCELHQTGD